MPEFVSPSRVRGMSHYEFDYIDVENGGEFVGRVGHADVTAVIVTYNSGDDLRKLIADLRSPASEYRIRVIVVDNGSSDNTLAVAGAHPDVIAVASGGNLGYAGGINVGLDFIGDCDFVLMLNPDLRLSVQALPQLIRAGTEPTVGAVVPLVYSPDGFAAATIRREPSIGREVGKALFGGKFRSRPAFLAEIDYRRGSYTVEHDIEWAVGAAVLIPHSVINEVGSWNEEYFLYSEETDYFRRIRALGKRVVFVPSAKVMHHLGGSGRTSDLVVLQTINRIRYVESCHGRFYSSLFRAATALGELCRCRDATRRRGLAFVTDRRRWQELPKAQRVGAGRPALM